jgi:acetyltransferase-like isoleucine patch superfamily enzyme
MFSLYKGLLYFLAFLGPALLLSHYRALPIAALLGLAILGVGFAGMIFLALIVLTQRIFIGSDLTTGIFTIDAPEGKRWFASAMLNIIVHESPFRKVTTGLSVVAPWYFRGMGAKMSNSVLLGTDAFLFDPYFLNLGENVTIGAGAMILGHIGHGREFTLARVVIGNGVLVGVRAVIFPGVHIGNGATVAAGSLVPLGTVIPPGETWGGIPARKLERRPRG